MQTAQRLYENGYITYMRTDSTTLSDQAVKAARAAVGELYGQDFLSRQPRQYQTKVKNAQEAHEAIRPAGAEMPPADQLPISGQERALYDLIWKRAIATQMAAAEKIKAAGNATWYGRPYWSRSIKQKKDEISAISPWAKLTISVAL